MTPAPAEAGKSLKSATERTYKRDIDVLLFLLSVDVVTNREKSALVKRPTHSKKTIILDSLIKYTDFKGGYHLPISDIFKMFFT